MQSVWLIRNDYERRVRLVRASFAVPTLTHSHPLHQTALSLSPVSLPTHPAPHSALRHPNALVLRAPLPAHHLPRRERAVPPLHRVQADHQAHVGHGAPGPRDALRERADEAQDV